MADGRRDAARRAPAAVERFLKQLVVTDKAVALYPPFSTIPRENAGHAVALLRTLLQSRPDASFEVTKDGLVYQDALLFPGQPAYVAFARELYSMRLAEVRFHAGAGVSDVLGFLGLLRLTPQEVTDSGGFEAGLWERQVDSITVIEVAVHVFDAAEIPSTEEASAEELDASRIQELLLGTFARRGRDHVVLERVLGDSRAIGVFLADALATGPRRAAEVSGRLGSLAHAVEESAPERRPAMFRALAEAVLELEPELRREVLRTRILPSARTDEPVAQVVRQMSVDQVSAILVEGFSAGEVGKEGLARAVRNLAQIGVAPRDELMNAVGASMREQRVPQDELADVLQAITPSRLEIRERPARSSERPVESIVRLVDLASGAGPAEAADDEELIALRDEAHRGFTDGDVLVSLVTLVGLDARPEAFASVMSVVEDGMGVLFERGEFEVAADITEALISAQSDAGLDVGQRGRIGHALRVLATPDQMRLLNHAFRVYPPGSPEHGASERLLALLGGHVLEPMLEVLSREQDMAARKSMVDLMSTMAGAFIDELGGRVTDERWFFVRNVVCILGRTRRPSILPYLERTLRHHDARVRRETIRAAAGVPDRRAAEMLIAALADDDAQNVSIASRYLGLGGVRGAVGALVEVARGEGPGNRDVGARVEAIEALGRIGDTAALGPLEALASRRAVLRGRGREVRTAAMAAVAAIRGSTGGAA